MRLNYLYLEAPNIYLFWCKEDPIPYLDIIIVEKIIEKADTINFPESTDRYSGYYYHEDYGWDQVYDDSVEFSRNHFELICMLDELNTVEKTEKMKNFFRNAIKDLFESNILS